MCWPYFDCVRGACLVPGRRSRPGTTVDTRTRLEYGQNKFPTTDFDCYWIRDEPPPKKKTKQKPYIYIYIHTYLFCTALRNLGCTSATSGRALSSLVRGAPLSSEAGRTSDSLCCVRLPLLYYETHYLGRTEGRQRDLPGRSSVGP